MPKKLTTEEFIAKAKLVHGDKYDYSSVVYLNTQIHVIIICPAHGKYSQTPVMHLQGRGCILCSHIAQGLKSRKSLEWFLDKARTIHGNTFDYSSVKYEGTKQKIIIGCPKHGKFKQRPEEHMAGQGCPVCRYDTISKKTRKDLAWFLERAKQAHGDMYDYSKVKYEGDKVKIVIGCPIHGEFSQTPNRHFVGGCIKCGLVRGSAIIRKDLAWFLERAKQVHGTKFDYSKVEYRGVMKKVKIICPAHGEFLQIPNSHFKLAQGCPTCGRDAQADKNRVAPAEFLQKAITVHGNKYNYSETEYIEARRKIKIICSEHGPFWQVASSHLSGYGCRKCNQSYNGVGWRRTEWISIQKERKAMLYVIELTGVGETFYKIGITYNILQRFGNYSMPYHWRIIASYESRDAGIVYDLEHEMHRQFNHLKYKPALSFRG